MLITLNLELIKVHLALTQIPKCLLSILKSKCCKAGGNVFGIYIYSTDISSKSSTYSSSDQACRFGFRLTIVDSDPG